MKRLAILLALTACGDMTPRGYAIAAGTVAVTGGAIVCAADCPHDSGERYLSDGVLIMESAAVVLAAIVVGSVIFNADHRYGR